MSETGTVAPKGELERWIYLGVRQGEGTSLWTAWVREPAGAAAPDERDAVFYGDGKTAALVLGGVYEVRVTRADGKTTRHGAPVYARERIEDADLLATWSAVAGIQLARRDKGQAQEALNDALEPLLKLARKVPNGPQRDAFVAHVMMRLIGGW